MKIVPQSVEIMSDINGIKMLKNIEKIARTCYKSENKISDDSHIKLLKGLMMHEHHAMIEHETITVKFVTDRGISHEIVRHRIASFAQESTRYCNYGKSDIQFINPGFEEGSYEFILWKNQMLSIEKTYNQLLENGVTPQIARSVLPNSLKTELVVTMNLRSWLNFFKLRTPNNAHPQIRELSKSLLKQFRELIPIIFDNI